MIDPSERKVLEEALAQFDAAYVNLVQATNRILRLDEGPAASAPANLPDGPSKPPIAIAPLPPWGRSSAEIDWPLTYRTGMTPPREIPALKESAH